MLRSIQVRSCRLLRECVRSTALSSTNTWYIDSGAEGMLAFTSKSTEPNFVEIVIDRSCRENFLGVPN